MMRDGDGRGLVRSVPAQNECAQTD
jgi:hypothetical protein